MKQSALASLADAVDATLIESSSAHGHAPPAPLMERLTSAALADHLAHVVGRPAWAYEGTPYVARQPLPPLLPVAHALRIAANVAERLADPYLHFRIARSGPPPLDASLALALQHAPRLADALQLAARHCRATVPHLAFDAVTTGSTIECIVRPAADLGAHSRMQVEAHLDVFYRCVEWRRGLELAGARVEFAHAAPPDAEQYRAWLRCEVRFGAGRNALVVPAAWDAAALPGHDRGLWLLGRDRVLAEIQALREPARVQDVRERVAARLEIGQVPRLKQVAADCAVSTRTLIRSLRIGGTTFHEIVESERRARALELILRPSVPLAHLARDLGFPDRSSFGRRFRAWFGDSPARFRHRMALATLLAGDDGGGRSQRAALVSARRRRSVLDGGSPKVAR